MLKRALRSGGTIFWLGTKELRSFLHDTVLIVLVIYAFSLAVISQARSNSQELNKASIAFSDEDNSPLSRRIIHAFLPPLFLPPQPIAVADIVPAMNAGHYTFVIDIPRHFERDVLAGKSPGLQIDVDATAMIQAGLGSGYANQIIDTEIADYLSNAEGIPPSPVNLIVRIAFNPNVMTAWFSSVMGIINNVTMLAIIMSGAAVIREREHGTMDHLLAMPISPFQIAMSKVWANGLIITVAVALFTVCGGARDPGRADCRVYPAVHGGRCDLSFFRHRHRHFSGHCDEIDAAARPVVHARLPADEYAVGQQHAAGEHAALACDCHAGLPLNAFCGVRAIDSLSWRRVERGMAAVCCSRRHRGVVSDARTLAVPLGRRSDQLTSVSWCCDGCRSATS